MTDESDIDLLYQKKNNIKFSLLDRINIINYLSNIFQKKIDIVNKDSINFRIKDEILKNKIDII
jgi:predicted nucleotidyltransferase